MAEVGSGRSRMQTDASSEGTEVERTEPERMSNNRTGRMRLTEVACIEDKLFTELPSALGC